MFIYTCVLQGGPLVLVRLLGGVYTHGKLGVAQLTGDYTKRAHYDAALLLLNQVDWGASGQTLLACLGSLFNRLIRQPFDEEVEQYLEACLGLYYAPSTTISQEVSAYPPLEKVCRPPGGLTSDCSRLPLICLVKKILFVLTSYS